MNQITVEVNGRQVTVSKLPLRRYAELLGAFEELPKHLGILEKSNDEIVQNLPTLISTCYPDVVRVLKVATDLQDAEIDEMGLDDFIKVVEAILEVNNYAEIYQRLKKMIARPRATTNEVGSGTQ